MGLFSFLDKSDSSDSWKDYVRQPIALDVRSATLNGLQLGAPASELARFGKPSNKRPFKSQKFDFLEGGFTIEIDAGHVSYFGLAAVQFGDDPIGACALRSFVPMVHRSRLMPTRI